MAGQYGSDVQAVLVLIKPPFNKLLRVVGFLHRTHGHTVALFTLDENVAVFRWWEDALCLRSVENLPLHCIVYPSAVSIVRSVLRAY